MFYLIPSPMSPGHNTFAVITLNGSEITAEFLCGLVQVFTEHHYDPGESCRVINENPPWDGELAWGEAAAKTTGSGGTIFAILWQKPEIINQFVLNYTVGSKCNRLLIDAYIGFSGGTYYGLQAKENAIALQTLCLDLHQRLNAVETIVTNENEEVLFHFSREEWKSLGDFPTEA